MNYFEILCDEKLTDQKLKEIRKIKQDEEYPVLRKIFDGSL